MNQKRSAEELHKARELVAAWRNDDEELRIPMNDFGHELAQAIDVLLEVTKPPAISITINDWAAGFTAGAGRPPRFGEAHARRRFD